MNGLNAQSHAYKVCGKWLTSKLCKLNGEPVARHTTLWPKRDIWVPDDAEVPAEDT